MSDEKIVTERAAVKRERNAFRHGAMRWALREISPTEVDADAAQLYPLPRVTRPRAITDPHGLNVRWTVRDGVIRPFVDSAWGQSVVEKITPQRVAVWADLIANPTEEVAG